MSVDKLIAGMQTYLASRADLVALLGGTDNEPWIFQRDLSVLVSGTSNAAIVLHYAGQSSGPNIHNTMMSFKVNVAIYVDPARDADLMTTDITSVDAESDALKIWRIVDKYLHRVGGGTETWGEAVSLSSKRLSALSQCYLVPDGNGLIRGDAFYEVQL